MAGSIMLDNLVSVSELSHGGASRAIGRVGDGNPVVVMRNNKPAAVIISPDEYRRLTKTEEDFALYLEAMERTRHDDGARLTAEDVFGRGYKPVDDGYEPEFE
ncbi:antitoxin Phd/YefM, type II toxin-antitoxin system domain protein [Bifidobacterium saguini DSM 23967]|uniref:Antitoxin n=1 Tax=Bifidobacterium saguini DSM 23967 TaxID=1437607 RepID=A0A087DCG8_9BIFI|nr:type II toxin-antitoxin system prevent-host-death family antitoxin [Bifidobacterium saguini]KFI93218.1 antitoxin Phd/YefM, type II toxin-antitoxin system domain protein [Bifidobacterium saguini DSM 23967]